MKAQLKKTVLVAATVFVLIQFIQPARNESGQVLDTDISKIVSVPDEVQSIVKNDCYDCHSNNTRYPWYTYIQPVGWFMRYHIRNGKEKLNFSDFGSYPKRRQTSKLDAIAKQIEDDVMPLNSYRWMHKNANLTSVEQELIIQWANSARDSLSRQDLKK